MLSYSCCQMSNHPFQKTIKEGVHIYSRYRTDDHIDKGWKDEDIHDLPTNPDKAVGRTKKEVNEKVTLIDLTSTTFDSPIYKYGYTPTYEVIVGLLDLLLQIDSQLTIVYRVALQLKINMDSTKIYL
jgi:hypothetical protein